jgi:hypothetical protein
MHKNEGSELLRSGRRRRRGFFFPTPEFRPGPAGREAADAAKPRFCADSCATNANLRGRASAHGCPAQPRRRHRPAERDRVSREEDAWPVGAWTPGGLSRGHCSARAGRWLLLHPACVSVTRQSPAVFRTRRVLYALVPGRPGACCSTSIVGVALLHHSPMVPLFIMQSRATTDPAIHGIRTDLCADL